MTVLSIAFETRSACNLVKAGADRYAADPTTGVWCMAWALDDDPVEIWHPGQKFPAKVIGHIEAGGTVTGWNVAFELAIWENVILRDYPDLPPLKIEQLDDTMARALASSLPAGLEKCSIAANLPLQKDREGYLLMMRMCVPVKEWRDNPVGPPVWYDVKSEKGKKALDRLGEYCKRDVEVERELRKRIDPLSDRERKLWLLDRRINRRGVAIDTRRVNACLKIADQEKRRLSREMAELTNGAVRSANSVPQMLAWLETRGVKIDNLKKRPVSRLLRSNVDIDSDARRALEIRLEISKASTAKLKSMLNSQDVDGRCRGLFFYHGAATGRWAGKRIQLHNFPRPEFFGVDDDDLEKCIETCLDLFDQPNGSEVISLMYADPLHAISACLRGLIVAADGHQFIGGDFTGIENRVLMWLAGEDWMIEEFRKFDRGEGVDNYKLTYAKAFGVPIEEVGKPQRLIGKVGALACGFSGAVGAYINMGDVYDVVPSNIAKSVRETVSTDAWMRAAEKYPKEEKWRFGLDLDTWTGIRVVVDAWRAAHPNVNQYWWDLMNSATEAVQYPKTPVICGNGKVRFGSTKHFLLARLPSGRYIAYAKPSIEEVKRPDGSKRTTLNYWGLGKKTKRWEQRALTPQIMSENVTSGTARDVLTDAMHRVEARNYPIVLHVHDELVTEVPLGFGDVKEFESIMCDSAPWLKGLPVAAKGWSGPRFQK